MSKERKQLIVQLDKKTSKEILKDNPICVITGQPATEVHHCIHGRTNLKYRWDKRNLLPVSRIAHRNIHDGILDYEDLRNIAMYRDIISEQELDEIELDNTINKIYTHELQDTLDITNK